MKAKTCILELKQYICYGEHESVAMTFPLIPGEYAFDDVFYGLEEPFDGIGDFSKVIVKEDLSILYGGKVLKLKKGEASASFDMENEGFHDLCATIKVQKEKGFFAKLFRK